MNNETPQHAVKNKKGKGDEKGRGKGKSKSRESSREGAITRRRSGASSSPWVIVRMEKHVPIRTRKRRRDPAPPKQRAERTYCVGAGSGVPCSQGLDYVAPPPAEATQKFVKQMKEELDELRSAEDDAMEVNDLDILMDSITSQRRASKKKKKKKNPIGAVIGDTHEPGKAMFLRPKAVQESIQSKGEETVVEHHVDKDYDLPR